MPTDEEELRWWRHGVALLLHIRNEDADAYRALLDDPDVDVPNVIIRLARMMRLVLIAADNDPDDFLDRLAREMYSADADPVEFLARWREVDP